ncbi:MAG: DNA/RNA nuclease SfsA [Gammaproteobacteria bacterium]
MEYESHLTEGVYLSRMRSVLVKVAVSKEEQRTIYCPSLVRLPDWQLLGSRVWFSSSSNPKRKYPHTWELVEVSQGDLLYINTATTNDLILEGIEHGKIPELEGYSQAFKDVPLGIHNSRIGLLLEGDFQHRLNYRGCPLKHPYKQPDKNCLVMVENVMLYDEIHRGFFPDVASIDKKQKLKDLIAARLMGYRAVLFCCVQHNRVQRVCLADHIDKLYGQLLRQAIQADVEVYTYSLDITLSHIAIDKPLPLIIPRLQPIIR